MRTFLYNKLIRDKIVDSMLANGETPDFHICSDGEFVSALTAKLSEEVAELQTHTVNPNDMLKELADLAELIDALVAAIGKSKVDLDAAREVKNYNAGSFSRRIWVDKATLQDDNPWIDYLVKNSDRYPELKKSQK